MTGYLSRTGFTQSIYPTPTTAKYNPITEKYDPIPALNVAQNKPFNYIDTHALMHRIQSIRVVFRQAFYSDVVGDKIEEHLFYDPETGGYTCQCYSYDPDNPEIPPYPSECPRGSAWPIKRTTQNFHIDATFIPYGVKIVQAAGPNYSSYIENLIPKQGAEYLGGFPNEDLTYYYRPPTQQLITAWNPIPNDFSRWWFSRYHPQTNAHSPMRPEHKGTALKNLYTQRYNVQGTEYKLDKSYLMLGRTYRAITSDGFMINPYLGGDDVDEIATFSTYRFDQICECDGDGGFKNLALEHPGKKVLNFILTGSVDFYKYHMSNEDGDDISNYSDIADAYFVIFSTPITTRGWQNPYEYGRNGTKIRYNCDCYQSFVDCPSPFYTPPITNALSAFGYVTIKPECLPNLQPDEYSFTNGSKLHGFISNDDPDYVKYHLDEFFPGYLSQGSYHYYPVDFGETSGLPADFKLWVHTFRDPEIITGPYYCLLYTF